MDDGKSTLIGRLLLESQAIFEDQMEAVSRANSGELDLALFTDGLKAEREQRITIDVAYRYFTTSKRKFIIADCPGHTQYTRNMVTGASTAELAIILLDARKGLLTQSKRHSFLSTLLHIPHLVVAVNKMDLVDFSEQTFTSICSEFRAFASRLQVEALSFVPICALHGDNVVEKSKRMPWYAGSTLLYILETVNTGASLNLIDFRLPIQHVIRPHQDFRGFAGRLASGRLRVGESVVALPSGAQSKVTQVSKAGTSVEECFAGDSVVIQLADEIDLGRGDLLVRTNNLPSCSQNLDVVLCWLDESDLSLAKKYRLKLATRELTAQVCQLDYMINVDTMHRVDAETLTFNGIGRAQLRLGEPLFFDAYRKNREMGSFILIDTSTHRTVAAGMIRGTTPDLDKIVRAAQEATPRNLHQTTRLVHQTDRERHQGHRGAVVWLTGLSASGKSSIGVHLEKALFDSGHNVILLDGDSVRGGLCADLGFSDSDRRENIRRVAELSALLATNGAVVICAFISPFAAQRELARRLAGDRPFMEVFVNCSLQECQRRDPKGLYAQAAAGKLKKFTGLDSPYEAPLNPELTLDTEELPLEKCVQTLLLELRGRLTLAPEV